MEFISVRLSKNHPKIIRFYRYQQSFQLKLFSRFESIAKRVLSQSKDYKEEPGRVANAGTASRQSEIWAAFPILSQFPSLMFD